MKVLSINKIDCVVSDRLVIDDIKTRNSIFKYVTKNWTYGDNVQDELLKIGLDPQSVVKDGKFTVINFTPNTDIALVINLFNQYYPSVEGRFYGIHWCRIFKIVFPSEYRNRTLINTFLRSSDNAMSSPKKFSRSHSYVYLYVSNNNTIDQCLSSQWLETFKNNNIQVFLDIPTAIIPPDGTFNHMFGTLGEYIKKLFDNALKIKYAGTIKFISDDIGLKLRARRSIQQISIPTILKFESDTIEHLLSKQISDDHYDSAILNQCLDGRPGKIIIKKSTGQIFVHALPKKRAKISAAVLKYLNDPINKIYIRKIFIGSHSNTVSRYIKNIKSLLEYSNINCQCVHNYLIIKATNTVIEQLTQVMQQMVSQIINTNECDIPKLEPIEVSMCVLCFNSVDNRAYLETCSCIYCTDCFKQLLYASQRECMSCYAPINLSDLALLNDCEISRIFVSILDEYLAANPSYVRCLTPDCPAIYHNTVPRYKFLYCDLCSHVYCLECQYDYYGPIVSHDGLTCDQYKNMRVIDTKTDEWLNTNTKKCPGCTSTIQRTEGCLHIICKRCNHEFCWSCLKLWSNVDHSSYNCSNKNIKLKDDSSESSEKRSYENEPARKTRINVVHNYRPKGRSRLPVIYENSEESEELGTDQKEEKIADIKS
jgi:23S rRNA maturation mini-RNase III